MTAVRNLQLTNCSLTAVTPPLGSIAAVPGDLGTPQFPHENQCLFKAMSVANISGNTVELSRIYCNDLQLFIDKGLLRQKFEIPFVRANAIHTELANIQQDV